MDIKDIKNIRELAKLMGNSDISEITIEDGDAKLTVKREKTVVTTSAVVAAPAAPVAAPVAAAVAVEAAPAAPVSDLLFVTAPLVGTFYASSSPDSPPFAKVGDQVKKGQVICIIEAMKLMNEIESDVDGVIEEVCLNNAEPVDYGAKIFGIKQA